MTFSGNLTGSHTSKEIASRDICNVKCEDQKLLKFSSLAPAALAYDQTQKKEISSLCASLAKEFHELYLRKALLHVIYCVRKNVENIPLGALFIAFPRRMVSKFLIFSSLTPVALAESEI